MLSIGLCFVVAAVAAAPAQPKPPEDCDALYYGDAGPKDYPKALACFRAQEDWAMVAIMQLNGEGAPVDVPGARATFRRLVGSDGFMDADAQALDKILTQREKHPGGKSHHIDFCTDVAGITPSLGYCSRREEDRVEARDQKILDTVRTQLADDARPIFDAAVEAFRSFVAAEAERTYEKYIDGTIRAQASIYAESFARADFMRAVQRLTAVSTSGPTPGHRPFAAADRALNEAYRADVGGASAAYKTKSRTTQHRWVRYRDAMAKLAAARWPARPDAGDLARAIVTEDRIRELTPPEGDVR